MEARAAKIKPGPYPTDDQPYLIATFDDGTRETFYWPLGQIVFAYSFRGMTRAQIEELGGSTQADALR